MFPVPLRLSTAFATREYRGCHGIYSLGAFDLPLLMRVRVRRSPSMALMRQLVLEELDAAGAALPRDCATKEMTVRPKR